MSIQSISNCIEFEYFSNLKFELDKSIDKYDSDDYNEKRIIGESKEKVKRINDVNSSSETENRSTFIKPTVNDRMDNSLSSTDNLNEFSDDYLYKKPWTKLSSIHKIIKVKEFVQKLIINKEEDREKLKDSLINLINNKKLTKKDMVKYDSINARIIGIPSLKYSNGKYFIVM